MYAIYWTDSRGNSGNGQHVLDSALALAWLGHLRDCHPEMKHWAQDATGRVLSTSSFPSRTDAQEARWSVHPSPPT